MPHCCETMVHSKNLLSATLFVKFWRDYITFMSEVSSIVISRVRTSWWTTRVVSKFPTLVSPKSWKTVSHLNTSRCFGAQGSLKDLLPGNRLHRPSLQGSVYWMAPEVVKQVAYTKKADIWSVGCLIVEMLTGEHPWAQLNQMQAIFKVSCLGSFLTSSFTNQRLMM